MSAGLFALSCPECDAELEVDADAQGSCMVCRSRYLIRFGHLIPVSSTTSAESVALFAEG